MSKPEKKNTNEKASSDKKGPVRDKSPVAVNEQYKNSFNIF